MLRSSCSRSIAILAAFAWWAISSLDAAEPPEALASSAKSANVLRQYRSQNLVVYTNLPDPEAKAAIKSLEQTLAYAAKYWGQELRGQIECYLLHDLENISDADLPHRLSRVLVGGVGGATLPNRSRSGNRVRNFPIVLASTVPGVAEHEIVHAYCTQTFGFTGPNWYSEGMAEMAVLQCTRDSGVVCSAEQLQLLRASPQTTVSDVLAGDQSGARIFASMNAMLANPKNRYRQIPLSDWRQGDKDNVIAARQYYLRSWALCYMLLHNPNYASRFRFLGQKHVTCNDDGFPTVFAEMQKEVAFEYGFFLKNIGIGYRVDLCSWDWDKKFRGIEGGESITARIVARKGYQASGLAVTAGTKYRYEAAGAWSTSPAKVATEASGSVDERGRLDAIVLRDFELSEPFPLGIDGTFEAQATGHLYLRCNDAWNELHDNDGHTLVRFSASP